MNKRHILDEIRRIAAEGGNVAPGQEQFERLTGITPASWRGKLWLKWSDAVSEAGLTPGQMQQAHPTEALIAALAHLTRKHGHFPSSAEIRFERTQETEFPSHGTFDRLGPKAARIAQVRTFATMNPQFADILDLLPPVVEDADDDAPVDQTGGVAVDGYVYMLKHGKHYKIGKTYSVPRRHREIALELPEKPIAIHSIRTDDPDGIEAYWYRRFETRRTNGEWFALTPADVRVFKSRKTM